MNRGGFLFLAMVGLCLFCGPAWCSKAYVTDSFRISLRRGPSIENKILKFLPSGMPVEVLEAQDGWSQVDILEPGEGNVRGWVLSRYLVNRLPWEDQATVLKSENERLKTEVQDTRKELEEATVREQELSQRMNEAVQTITKVREDYSALREESAGFLELKANHEEALQTVSRLTAENEQLKSSTRTHFFGLGALVLLFGLVIGLVMGRSQKKRNSLY